jgi:hypothetical protein
MRVVKHLAAGTYRVSVVASEALGIHLIGPGVNRYTRVAISMLPHLYPTNTTWTITLRRGIYRYGAIGQYASDLRLGTGSFRVP